MEIGTWADSLASPTSHLRDARILSRTKHPWRTKSKAHEKESGFHSRATTAAPKRPVATRNSHVEIVVRRGFNASPPTKDAREHLYLTDDALSQQRNHHRKQRFPGLRILISQQPPPLPARIARAYGASPGSAKAGKQAVCQ